MKPLRKLMMILHEHEIRRLALGPVLVVRPISPQPTVSDRGCPKWERADGKRIPGGPQRSAGGKLVSMTDLIGEFCPLGQPGEVRFVKERWRPVMESYRSYVEYADGTERALLGADADKLANLKLIALHFPGARKDRHSDKWRSAASMPEWASRYLVRIEEVRAVRCDTILRHEIAMSGLDGPEFYKDWTRRYGKRYPWESSWAWVVRVVLNEEDCNGQ